MATTTKAAEAVGFHTEWTTAMVEALTAPFPTDEIETLPKQLRRDDKEKFQCRQGTQASADGHYCGGYHARSVHLSYIGHAGITTRLNEVVGPHGWDWQPVAWTPDPLEVRVPQVGREFWITLTILGVAKYGVGDDFNGSAKQAISDALRNAAMRFGIATYLWSKSDRAGNLVTTGGHPESAPPPPDPKVQIARAQAIYDAAVQVKTLDDVRACWGEASEQGLLDVMVDEALTGNRDTLGEAIKRLGDAIQTAGA